MSRTAIIIPCYNEARRLKISSFHDYIAENKEVNFIFVNDGSTDNTHKFLDGLCNLVPKQLLLIDLDRNYGKAEAVRQGFLKAIKMDFENIGYWDADLSTPLYLINRLCEHLDKDNVSIVMGSRVKLLGYNVQRKTSRHYLGRIFATCASIVLRLPVYDTQCGAKIFKNNSELKKVFSKPFTANWAFDVEILARFMLLEGNKGINPLVNSALEYPLEQWIDIDGSKVKPADFIISALELGLLYLKLYCPFVRSKYYNRFKD
jgi:glycosyltransferase involved in cell wall biosynthesis